MKSTAVFSISYKGMPEMGHLNANLMMASSVKPDLYEGISVQDIGHMVMKLRMSGSGSIFGADTGSVRTSVLYEKVLQTAFFWLWNPFHKSCIIFPEG